MRRDYEGLKELLRYYFNGELDRIIDNLKKKINRGFPDDFYCSLNSLEYTRPKASNASYYSDPTANRATKLADLRLNRERQYNKYLDIKKAIDEAIAVLNDEEILFIKAEIGLILWKETGAKYNKGKRRSRDLLLILSKKLKKSVEFIGLNNDDGYLDIELEYI